MTLQALFLILSLSLTLLFFIYGFNHYYLLNATRKYKTPPLPEQSQFRPSVSIQLPVYNERYVVRRLVTACAAMAEAYGIDRVKILVLDDSDDDTVLEIDKVVGEYKRKNFSIETRRRQNRVGFKAGALQAALDRTEEEFIAIFDADFIPSADFLLRTIPYFERDERLAIVQSRWTHLNRNYNVLTRAIALGIDVHFLVEQTGRYASGCFQNFNGSGGVLRKKAVMDAGGWRADTLAEDLDLSYRMQMLGYRFLFLRDFQVPCEIPPTVPGFKIQQGRWACGSLRNARKILPGLLKDREYSFKQRLQAFIHLTGYMIHPLMVFSFVLTCMVVLLGVNDRLPSQVNELMPVFEKGMVLGTLSINFVQNLVWAVLFPFIVLCTLAPWISLLSTLKFQNLSLAKNLSGLVILFMLSIGISLSNLREAARALLSDRKWEFIRTPKYADLRDRQDLRTRRYHVPLDSLWVAELIFALVGCVSIWSAVRVSNISSLLILVPFTLSYALVFLLSILQGRKAKV